MRIVLTRILPFSVAIIIIALLTSAQIRATPFAPLVSALHKKDLFQLKSYAVQLNAADILLKLKSKTLTRHERIAAILASPEVAQSWTLITPLLKLRKTSNRVEAKYIMATIYKIIENLRPYLLKRYDYPFSDIKASKKNILSIALSTNESLDSRYYALRALAQLANITVLNEKEKQRLLTIVDPQIQFAVVDIFATDKDATRFLLERLMRANPKIAHYIFETLCRFPLSANALHIRVNKDAQLRLRLEQLLRMKQKNKDLAKRLRTCIQ